MTNPNREKPRRMEQQIQDKCAEIVMDIFMETRNPSEQFGLVCLAATHFMGTGAAIMKGIAASKRGPQQSMEEWVRAMAEVIAEMGTRETIQ